MTNIHPLQWCSTRSLQLVISHMIREKCAVFPADCIPIILIYYHNFQVCKEIHSQAITWTNLPRYLGPLNLKLIHGIELQMDVHRWIKPCRYEPGYILGVTISNPMIELAKWDWWPYNFDYYFLRVSYEVKVIINTNKMVFRGCYDMNEKEPPIEFKMKTEYPLDGPLHIIIHAGICELSHEFWKENRKLYHLHFD